MWSDPKAIQVAPVYENSGDIATLPVGPITTMFGFLDFITNVIIKDQIPVSKKNDKLNIEPTVALELQSVFKSFQCLLHLNAHSFQAHHVV